MLFRSRGARVRAEIVGFGTSTDGFDMALPEPSGEHAAKCMMAAIQGSGISPGEVGAVNTHGTGTPKGIGTAHRACGLREAFRHLRTGSVRAGPRARETHRLDRGMGTGGRSVAVGRRLAEQTVDALPELVRHNERVQQIAPGDVRYGFAQHLVWLESAE